MRNCIVTIVSANYLAYARTLAESLREHAPESEFRLLVVDRPTEEIKRAVTRSGIQAQYAQDLGIPDFEHLAFKYQLVEFNTALKPTFLKSIFSEGFDSVIYLDPDIKVFSALSPVLNALSSSDIVLTPHSTRPVLDGLRPSDIDYMRTGAYNLGFIALRRSSNTDEMLDWWESRCLSFGFNDVPFGTFVDQKWIDLVPAFFDKVCILKHPGCNIAYWNLHERTLSQGKDAILVNNQPLCFFHFSGVKASKPDVLSRHQTRHSIERGSILETLVSNYCKDLLRLEHESFSKIEYTYGRFDNGTPIPVLARRAATFLKDASKNPFSQHTSFLRKLTKAGIIKESHLSSVESNTLNFNQNDPKVKVVNSLIRWVARLITPERAFTLFKYFSLVGREANLSRVILNEPFEFEQTSTSNRLIPSRQEEKVD